MKIRILRIVLLIVVVLGIIPFYFTFLSKAEWLKVQEISKATYIELQEIDEMYGNLPYGAEIKEIYINQQLGDGYVYVYIEVPEKNEFEFTGWLKSEGKSFTKEDDVFCFTYFVSDSHKQFGEYEESEYNKAGKVYWTIGIGIIICLFIPFELFIKKSKVEKE